MAFPSIRSATITSDSSTTTSHTVNLPATIRAGDTIWVFVSSTVAGAIGWPDATWNEMFDSSPHAADDQVAAAWRKADGTEGATIVVTAGSGKMASLAIAVQDAADPTIRPPELSTVATGSATEPNATTCTPTGGAKDYLWYTFFAMEGEQTGITAYPTSYTLNQSGLANTGTGGAVTTNCTAAGAGRQLNAASEDAGVWDVTGTLDDWAAWTIAFHPADPITAPLDRVSRNAHPVRFPVLLPLGTSGLTLAVNLLQSTLAPIEPMGVNQYDWPNPLRITSQLAVDISSRPQEDGVPPFIPIDWRNPDQWKKQPLNYSYNLLPQFAPEEAPPFVPVTWNNPIPGGRNLVGFTLPRPQYYEDQVGFNQYDWPNPLYKGKPNVGFTKDRPQFSVDNSPFNQFNWPNPLIKGRPNIGFVEERPQFYEDSIQQNQYNWPNPLLKGRGQDWINFKQLEPPTEVPFLPIDYPNPLLKGQQNRGWEQERPQYYIDLTPNNQFNWPNPLLKKKGGQDWTNNLLENTLAPLQDAPKSLFSGVIPLRKLGLLADVSSSIQTEPGPVPQVKQTDWPLPLRSKRTAITWSYNIFNLTSIVPLVRQNDWPNPLPRKSYKQLGIEQSQKLTSIVGNPFTAIIYPNPLVKARIRQDYINQKPQYLSLNPVGFSCIITLGIGAPGDITCFTLVGLDTNPQPIFPGVVVNPLVKPYPVINRTWLQSRSLQLLTDQTAVGKQFTTNPTVRTKPVPNTWIQTRPVYFVEPTGKPFSQTNWPVPSEKFFGLIVDVNTYTGEIPLPGTAIPFKQQSAPNPLRKKPYTQKHEFYYVIDNNQPRIIQWTALPPARRRPIPHIWIQRPLVASPITNLPVGKQFHQVPVLKKILAQTWLSDSLAVGDLPIAQYDWQNPVLRLRGSVKDWIQARPYYYEESIPNRQTDWANPLVKIRPTISYLFIPQIQEIDVLHNLDWPNPLLRVRLAETHLVNLLGSTLFPGEGESPVGRYENVNPLIEKRGGQGWHFYYMVDDTSPNAPFVQTDWPNPVRRKKIVIDWRYFSSIAERPIIASSTTLPILKRKPIYDWLVNLQQNTLGPIPVTSVSQKDWPNPLRKKRDISLITQISDRTRFLDGNKPFSFIEFPIGIKRRIAGGWVDNPSGILNAVVGATPFTQRDWPVFLRIRRGGQDLIVRAYILPNIQGRRICIDSALTEYNLESAIEILDFNSGIIIYDLESGGEECQ